jgi:phosphoglycolate phosphatase-like HAD superfamily hydrolase
MTKKYFICDVDGVILDRMPIHRRQFLKELKNFDVDLSYAKKYYYQSAGKPLDNQFKHVLEKFEKSYSSKKIEEMKKRFFDEIEKEDPPIFEGVKETIEKIREMGLKIFYTSGSNTKNIIYNFEKNGIYFDYCLGSDKIKKGEGHIKKFYEFVKKQKNIDFGEFLEGSLYLGDGLTDMKIAKRYGILAIGITNTLAGQRLRESGADYVIDKIENVIDYI